MFGFIFKVMKVWLLALDPVNNEVHFILMFNFLRHIARIHFNKTQFHLISYYCLVAVYAIYITNLSTCFFMKKN